MKTLTLTLLLLCSVANGGSIVGRTSRIYFNLPDSRHNFRIQVGSEAVEWLYEGPLTKGLEHQWMGEQAAGVRSMVTNGQIDPILFAYNDAEFTLRGEPWWSTVILAGLDWPSVVGFGLEVMTAENDIARIEYYAFDTPEPSGLALVFVVALVVGGIRCDRKAKSRGDSCVC